MKEPNFSVKMQGPRKARVEMYDVLGPSWAGMIDAKSVAAQLKDAGELDEIELRINSPGGSAFEGMAIHNILKDHPAKVHVVVDGVAASAASLVAMAGDTVRIPKNALMMIHDPWSVAYGGESDFQKAINMLSATKEAAIASYAAKSKQPDEKIAQWMTDETWFTGQEAVDAGLADTTDKELPLEKVEPKSQVQALFQKAPNQFASLVALSALPKPTQEPPKMADEITPEVTPPQAEADTSKAKEKAAQKATNDERSRVQNIMGICNKAGKPELATQFIADGNTVEEVNAKMVEVLCQQRPPIGDGTGADLNLQPDENAAYKAEYAKDRAAYAKAGVTEEEYVQMRRIDDGKDVLATKAA